MLIKELTEVVDKDQNRRIAFIVAAVFAIVLVVFMVPFTVVLLQCQNGKT